MIPSVRGKTVTDVRIVENEEGGRHIFAGRCGGVEMIVRQPEPEDLHLVKVAEHQCTKRTIDRFIMAGMPSKSHVDPPTICHYPPHIPESTGFLFLTMWIGTEVVGFGRHFYHYGRDLKVYQTPDDDLVAECALCIIDPYQGKGLGTLYGQINKLICKTMGAKWLVGTTYTKGGMMKIRHRDGFDIIEILADGKQCRIRGKL
jgi:GNAT superfamily N-acetyltransferase